jgi:flagellar basal-body rod protein FlgB
MEVNAIVPNCGSVVWLLIFLGGVVHLIENLLFTKTMSLMGKGLDAASLRNKVISDNLANVDTPGFKRSDVVFEEELRRALTKTGQVRGMTTNPKHIPIGSPSVSAVSPKVVLQNDTTMRNDGNNVDIDIEMASMAKNTITYSALAQLLNGEFTKLKSAIFEGRR